MSTFKANEKFSRLDKFLLKQMPDYSRSSLAGLIKLGLVTVNNKPAKASTAVAPGDQVKVKLPAKEKPPKIDIIFEDKNIIAINKPAGILSHSRGGIESEYTVADFIGERSNRAMGLRGGVVHRLDRDTSGVMLLAKTPRTERYIRLQFKNRRVEKIYIAIVHGDAPIRRVSRRSGRFEVGPGGKSALTRINLIEAGEDLSLVLARPFTGRTHQLRVHLSYLGHPIAGDRLYDPDSRHFDRMLLHAYMIKFFPCHNCDPLQLKAEIPPIFRRYFKDLETKLCDMV